MSLGQARCTFHEIYIVSVSVLITESDALPTFSEGERKKNIKNCARQRLQGGVVVFLCTVRVHHCVCFCVSETTRNQSLHLEMLPAEVASESCARSNA